MKSGKILRLLSVMLLLPLLSAIVIGAPVLAAPLVSLSPNSGAAGTLVNVIGENFDSYIGDNIFIFFDSTEMLGSPLTVPETGVFSFSFNIPEGAEPGEHAVRVKNELTTLALATFILYETEISLDKGSGNTGTRVTIDGRGFSADKVVTFLYDNGVQEILGTRPAGSSGDFSFSFTVPESMGGRHRVSARNTAGDAAEAFFEVVPSFSPGASSGAAGDILTLSGTGFGRRTDVSVFFESKEVAFARTDDNGSFAGASFNIPSLPPGRYDIRVEDGAQNTARTSFDIVAGISLDKPGGSVGAGVLVAGTGFLPGAGITVRYDDSQVATATAAADGSFEVSFEVPVSRHGEHTVAVTDGTTMRQTPFLVEEEPPPAPEPRLPADAERVKAAAYFDWSPVTDASLPLSYHFQVGADSGFNILVLDKPGLVESEYALAGEEKLAAVSEDSPYYWRVKAVDAARNESAWSVPRSFLVLAPPPPELLSPETGIKAENEVSFSWETVSSLNPPVTYHLQVASDETFTSLVLEKKGISAAEYTLAEEESLPAVKKEFPYYWRVRAVDGEDNAGNWSEPGSFFVGFSFPVWLIIVLAGGAFAVIGFIAFLLGRRTAYYEAE